MTDKKQPVDPTDEMLSDVDELEEGSENETSVVELKKTIAGLEEELAQAKNTALRAQADYQNLHRRSRDEYSSMVKMATSDLVTDLLEPLEHLSMTAEQVKSQVLDMVIAQLWSVLKNHGIQELQVLGKQYDFAFMEVVDIIDGATEEDGVIVKVVKRGYSLNGQVIQHAKVVIGKRV